MLEDKTNRRSWTLKKNGWLDRQTGEQADERFPSHCLKIVVLFHLENSFNL